jgi:Xaa-Pro aminopeptidase
MGFPPLEEFMKNEKRWRRRSAALSMSALLIVALFFGFSHSADAAPTERTRELMTRRERVMAEMGSGMLILFSNDPKNFSNDVFYPFRQENNLYYLTGVNQTDITLILLPDDQEQREILFLPRRDPSREIWTGRMISREEAQETTGVSQVWDAAELEPFLEATFSGKRYDRRPTTDPNAYKKAPETLSGDSLTVWLLLGDRPDQNALFPQSHAFKDTLKKRSGAFRIRDALSLFAPLRLIKSSFEQNLLRKAIDITAAAHRRLMETTRPGMNESELDGLIYSTYRQYGARWGFPSIVGSGPNATTLHYEENEREMKAGELALIDIGAEVEHYTADITRTIPVSGVFSPEQRVIYEIVLAAQEAGLARIRPGASIQDVHNAARDVINNELKRLGLITDVEGNQYRMWFMHGTSHWIGLDVHDVGGRPPFRPGMTLTVEPGIYIREDALDHLEKTPENMALIEAIRPAFERFKNIGVRIEDDALVTENGYELLSDMAPRTAQEIERFMSPAGK